MRRNGFLGKIASVVVCVLVLLVSALPASAVDLDVPTWYGGAVKAFDRLGVSSAELPWWISKGTARKVLQLKDDVLTIDAKLDDRQNGVPSQADFDKALDAHKAQIQYQDTTVDVRKWLNALGETFSDGYAGSVNGSLKYGDLGYIPTEEEINQESVKLSHPSSYLLVQAMNMDDDETVATSPSSCSTMGAVVNAVDKAWAAGAETPGTVLAAAPPSYDPEFGDVIGYDSSDFKKYDSLTVLDRDGGSTYSGKIKGEIDAKAKGSGISSKNMNSQTITGKTASKSTFAGIMKNGTGLLKGALTQLGGDYLTGAVHDGLQNLIDLTYGTQAWCDSYAWGISSNNAVLGTLSVMGKTATKYLAGLDCDEEDARKQALEDQQWAEKMQELNSTKNMPTEYDLSDFPCGFFQGDKMSYSVCFTRLRSGVSKDDPDYSRLYKGENYWYLSGKIRFSFINRKYQGSFENLQIHTDYEDHEHNGNAVFRVQSYWKPDGTISFPFYDFKDVVVGETVPFSFVLTGLHGGYCPANGDEGRSGCNCLDALLSDWTYYSDFDFTDSGMGQKKMTFVDDLTSTTPTDKRPSADSLKKQQTPSPIPVSTSATTTGADGATYSSAVSGMSDGSGYAPSTIQTKVNDDGSLSGSVSIDTKAENGQTVNFGTGSLDGIYPNAAGKRLDLIDVKTGQSCFSEGYACADWVKETQQIVPDHQLDVNFKGTTKEYPALTYKCSYDVPGKITEVPLGECIAYAPQFKPEAQKSGQTTGEPDGSTSTNTTTEPDTGYSYTDCVQSATAETAAAWLYSPVTCAAHQLFIPDEKVMTTTAARFQRDTSDGIMPQFKALQTNWGAFFDSFGGDCHGIRVSFGWGDFKIFDDAEFLNACPGTQLDYLPKLCRAAITVGLAIVAFSICRKAVMAIFDYNIPDGGTGVV